jgi:hypothetical protein
MHDHSFWSCFKANKHADYNDEAEPFDRLVFDDDHPFYVWVSRFVITLYGVSSLVYGFMCTFRYNG